MMGLADKILNKLRKKMNPQQEGEVKHFFSPERTAEILGRVKDSWQDIEQDNKMLERFIDEWIKEKH